MGYFDNKYTLFASGDSQMRQMGLYTGQMEQRDAVYTGYKARVRCFQHLCLQTRQNFEDGGTIFFGTQFVASYPIAENISLWKL